MKFFPKIKVGSEIKRDYTVMLLVTAWIQCIAIDPILLGNSWSETTPDSTSVPSSLQRGLYERKLLSTYTKFFRSVNQIGNSTGLAANMTSGHVTDYVTLDSLVFVKEYTHDVKWFQMTLLSREGKGTQNDYWQLELSSSCKQWTCSRTRKGKQNGKDKFTKKP